MTEELLPWVSIGIQVLIYAVLITLAAVAVHDADREASSLHTKLMKAWKKLEALQRQLEVMEAYRKIDLETYQRRVDRWRHYANDLLNFALQQGYIAQWKADSDRKAQPFVDSDHTPL